MSRPLFQLGPRLALCADLLRGGAPLCDVGTDHAYLPIWLLKTGKVDRALGCDVNQGPLDKAAENARRYHVEDRLALRLSDGLREVRPEEAAEVVIAGMGGDLILRIVEEAPWLREEGRRLVLQPMTSAETLRRGLARLGFALLEERAVVDGGRPYSAFSAMWTGAEMPRDPVWPYLGLLQPEDPAARRLAEKVLRELGDRMEGARRGRGEDDPAALEEAMREIRKRFLEG